jgi:dephospho-CoA kinase
VNKGDRFIGWALAKDRLKRKRIHQSETDWVGAKFDYVIENDGTLEDLGKQVEGLLQFIKK